MRALSLMMIVLALMAGSSAFARKASHHFKHAVASKHQPAAKTDPGGVQRHPDDVALDRKIGSICRGR